jgi:hypothetical protein
MDVPAIDLTACQAAAVSIEASDMAGPGLAASMLYKLVAGGHTACPAFAGRVKADLIGLRCIDAGQPNLGGVDLNRVAVDDAGDAGDIGGQGWGGDQQGDDKPNLHFAVRLIDSPSLFAFVRIAVCGSWK